MTLVNAVESIGAASNQVELREQILKQIDVQTLRKDMSLSNATACCHHSGAGIAPTVSSIRSRTLSSPERSPALSARMEVDESTAPAPGYLRRHTDARGYQMQGSERIYHYQDNTLKIVPLSGKEGLALHWVPGNSRAVLEITCVNHPRMERVASPNLMEIDEL
ncbi:hypothetical protein FRC17_002055 [Serendipita sp. 399]|nr:hypothetical protein FRC17_002055 [Serendipita sp. 399]